MTDLKLLVKNGKRMSFSPPYASFANFLKHQAQKYGQKTALVGIDVDTGHRSQLTYSDLQSFTIKMANYLTDMRITRDDNIAILMQNTAEVLLFELAAGLLGAATVPLDYKRDTLDRKIFKLKDTKSKVLFVKSAEETEEIKSLSQQAKTVVFSSYDHILGLLDKQAQTPSFYPVADLENRYLILYTSGTTTLPKGVSIRARALLANADGIAKWQKLTPEDRFSIILPLHHINSTTMSLATLLAGGTVVLSSRYSVSKFWETVAQEKCTITSVVPTVLHDLLTRHSEFFRDKLNISYFKRVLIGSAPVLPEESFRFYNTFKVRVVQGYGQTETALRVTGVPVDLSATEYMEAVKSNTIGLELANNNVTIIKKGGTEAKEKEEGEICIRGPILADGYWNNTKETKKAFYKGWFHSGDLGYYQLWNNTKYFFIKGRLKEIIIKGGINLSPALIEDALLKSFPEIDEVSVVGFQDVRMGEEVAAVIVPKKKLSSTDLSNLCNVVISKDQSGHIPGLSHYEAPQKVFIVDTLPKTSTGKIQRVEVKKMVEEKIKQEPPVNHFVRQIKLNELNVLKEILGINNARWKGLPSTLDEFRARAQNGLLFGVFDRKEELLGSISCLRLPLEKVMKLKTWDEATAHGTLANYDPKGDTLLCVAISVKKKVIPSKFKLALSEVEWVEGSLTTIAEDLDPSTRPTDSVGMTQSKDQLQLLASQKIEEYIKHGKDHVIEFHRKPKGGLPGAGVWKILPQGRPDDKDAMGYNILMKYPDITASTKIIRSHQASPSVMLIEHVLLYAKEHGIKHVIAFSRPRSFGAFLLDKLQEKHYNIGHERTL